MDSEPNTSFFPSLPHSLHPHLPLPHIHPLPHININITTIITFHWTPHPQAHHSRP
ncbi:hypothetical protein CUMW_264530 [Citrus unshiu]|uniref:Uncharacterized protein n=1 Tax=Citrus unshiu TaxID=55188 RepID=A0A2H5QV25_CITUN|nr:hypothetical protein CUMW_264530 [Citrus unshiu]